MNIFVQEYIKIINHWNSNLLLEANLKSLIPLIQDNLLMGQTYQNLDDEEKKGLQFNINKVLNNIESKVNEITDNKQYQSWIYNILKNQDVDYSDLKPIENTIFEFNKLAKRPDLKPQQKNIQNYNSFNDLRVFINNFKEDHKLQSNIYNNLKKVYSNSEFTVYFINKDQYEECNKLFGGTEYFNTGWCIAKNKQYFNQYINENLDKFNGYFVFIKDNKPYALLHYGSQQFKDDSDKTLKIDNSNILDCLMHINNNLNDYTKKDLKYYGKQLFPKEYPNATKEDLIAYQIGGEYNPKTKIIDCKGNSVQFKEEWLDENGTFNFNLINTSDDCSWMFDGCKNLTKLPNNFFIPDSIKDCSWMFYECKNLIKLPDNFAIPDGVTDCSRMFYECKNLIKLPDNFAIPDGVTDCSRMFYKCENLKELPNNFTISNSVKHCSKMFFGCENLIKLPNNFSIPKNSNYEGIFDNSGLEGKYNINDLLR